MCEGKSKHSEIAASSVTISRLQEAITARQITCKKAERNLRSNCEEIAKERMVWIMVAQETLSRMIDECKQARTKTKEPIQCREIVQIRTSGTCCTEGLGEEPERDITEEMGVQRVKEATEVAMGGTLGTQDEARVAGLG